MPDLDEPYLVLTLAEGFHETIDAVAGQAKDHFDSPILKSIEENVGVSSAWIVSSEK